MKRTLYIIFLLLSNNLYVQGQIDCNGVIRSLKQEISSLKQEISDLKSFNSSLQRQNSELQTKLIICQGRGDVSPPHDQAKDSLERIIEKNIQLINTKEKLLITANQENDKLNDKIKDLNKLTEKKIEENTQLVKEIEELKSKYVKLEKQYQDSMKSVNALKAGYQVLYDSLYLSINLKKEIIHLDTKFFDDKEKEAGLGDILVDK